MTLSAKSLIAFRFVFRGVRLLNPSQFVSTSLTENPNTARIARGGSMEIDASRIGVELYKNGGEWLGAARSWAQWHIRDGDRLCWDSPEFVNIRFCDLWDMALHVDAAAISEDRMRR